MTTTSSHRHIAACSAQTAAPVAVCSLRISASDHKTRLIPAGTFDAPRGSMRGGGPWRLDEAHARRIIQQAATRNADIVVDYEHQTLLSETNGQPAPAAGWVAADSLEWRTDGLYGVIQWTATAKAAVSPGPDGEPPEYRYLSPVFPYAADTGDVLDLLHLSLTNNPAISDGDAVLAAARRASIAPQQDEDSTVNREQLIKALGLATDATDEQIDQAIAALRAGSDDAKALRKALGAKDDTKPEDAVAVLKSGAPAAPDMSQYVPRGVYEESQKQVAALRAGGETAERDRLIEEGLKDGRIAGQATADWLKGQGLAALKAHLQDAPPVAALSGTSQTGGKPPKQDGPAPLTESELAVCRSMGITAEEYRKSNPQEGA